jgi:ferritin-like metal-binding protein YciE
MIEADPTVKYVSKSLYATSSGEGTSTWKESAGQCVAMGQGLSGAFVGEKLVKRAITEISCYNILIAAAAAVGDSETRRVPGYSE